MEHSDRDNRCASGARVRTGLHVVANRSAPLWADYEAAVARCSVVSAVILLSWVQEPSLDCTKASTDVEFNSVSFTISNRGLLSSLSLFGCMPQKAYVQRERARNVRMMSDCAWLQALDAALDFFNVPDEMKPGAAEPAEIPITVS